MVAFVTWIQLGLKVIIERKKVIGKQTQRRVEFFDEQTANGKYIYNLFIKALQCAGIPVAKMFETASNLKIVEKNHPIMKKMKKFQYLLMILLI